MNESRQGPILSLLADGIEIPAGIVDLERFRAWARSDDFPERGRIDWVAGRLEVDMSLGELNTHQAPKSAIFGQLGNLIQEPGSGIVSTGRTRFSSPAADLSVEPDILVLLVETVEQGRTRLVPKTPGSDDFVEIEGTVDLAVECVSDASTVKDRKRLREAYYRAGVPEYWLVDVRSGNIQFQILVPGKGGYVPAPAGADGFVRSTVVERAVRLVIHRQVAGLVSFRLEVRE